MEFDYDLECQRIIDIILKNNYSLVCLQLPDGLKSRAKEITDIITKETKTKVIIWAGSNFGACDLSLEVKKLGVEALFHFGHSKFCEDNQ
jgi:diphthamide biosynthesis enzyme Dph1/Dph2-like protein